MEGITKITTEVVKYATNTQSIIASNENHGRLIMMFSASTDIWRYQFHPEVWIIVISSVLLAFYATRVVGPNAVKATNQS